MEPSKHAFKTIDEYHALFPVSTQELLTKMRSTIRRIAPEAEEVISYGMPAFKWHGLLVWYAGYKNHIGFYPSASPIEVFKKQLTKYKTSKGAIQFPIDQEIPVTLVEDIVRFRMEENLEKERIKKEKKKK